MKQALASFFRSCGLPLVVFFTGACVLVLEIVATRILSPYYGSTIFTVSSVITVVLAALSLGYFFGGRLADRRPELPLFFTLIFFSGIAVMLTYVLMVQVLKNHGYDFSIMTGPLVFSLALFFLPSLLMGMLSPFALKLQAQLCPDKGMGSIAGAIFFWSTLGSIAGSLAAGFFLIPSFGIRAIVITTGLALSAVGLVLALATRGYKKKEFSAALILALALALPFWSAVKTADRKAFGIMYEGKLVEQQVMYEKDGTYEKVMMTYSPAFRGHPAHILILDRSYSAMMFLDTDEPAAPYCGYAMAYAAFRPEVKDLLVLGGGGYIVPMMFLDSLPDVRVDVAEIEPTLIDLGRKFFSLDTENPRLRNFVQDGRRVLHESDRTYDMIFSDVFNTLYSVPAHMSTREFFETAKAKLNADGLFMANLSGNADPRPPSFLWSEIKTFCGVFPNCHLFQTRPDTPDKTQNFIMVGINGDKKPDFSAPEIVNSENPVIRGLSARAMDLSRIDLSPYPVLTDDYAPVDAMSAALFRRTPEG